MAAPSKVTKELVAQLLSDPKQAVCPRCGGRGFWDNREKAKGKAPHFVCRNKEECASQDEKGYAFGVFGPEVKALGGESASAPSGAKSGPVKAPPAWSQIRVAYAECVALATKAGEQIGAKGVPIVGENITAMANTLMMTREKLGCWPALGAKSSDEGKAKAEVAQPKAAFPRDDGPYAEGPNDDGIPW